MARALPGRALEILPDVPGFTAGSVLVETSTRVTETSVRSLQHVVRGLCFVLCVSVIAQCCRHLNLIMAMVGRAFGVLFSHICGQRMSLGNATLLSISRKHSC